MIVKKKPEFRVFGATTVSGEGGGEANVGSNLGSGSEVYAGKTGVILNFRTLVSSSPEIEINQESEEILISFDASTLDHGNLQGLADDDHPQYLNTARHNAITGNVHDIKLDSAYDGRDGSGAGRTVTVDSGAVCFDSSGGVYAPLELVPRSSFPSSDLRAGQLVVNNNLLFLYDASRAKFLSAGFFTLLFGRGASNQGTQYLRVIDSAPTSAVGFRIPWNCTVVAMSVQTQNNASANFQIRRNGSSANLYSLTLSGVQGNHANNVNVDLSAGDFVQIRMQVSSGSVDYPEVALFLAIRGT